MQPVTTLPAPTSHIGAVAFVEFGRALGLPTLVGKGRIVDERVRGNTTYLLVEPIEGMKLEKWVSEHDIRGYDWSQPSVVNTTLIKTEAA